MALKLEWRLNYSKYGRYKPVTSVIHLDGDGEIRSIIPPPPCHIELAHIASSHFDRIHPPSSLHILPNLPVEIANTKMNPVILD